MPLYRDRISQELEEKKEEFTGLTQDQAIEDFVDGAKEVSRLTKDEIEGQLEDKTITGAVPTEEIDTHNSIIIPFDEASDWSSHQAVNEWARGKLEEVITVAADGSQIDPVAEFEHPVGLVQVIWIANHHDPEGLYEEDVEIEVLTPGDLLFENPNTGFIQVDDQEVPVTRFEEEMRALEKQIIEYKSEDNPPVVMYDGSLILSFTQMFDQKVQERYAKAMSRLLAASEFHQVPVVGYISGSRATELAKMIQSLGFVDTSKLVRDYQFLEDLTVNWGDRSIVFSSRRDQTLNQLQTSYRGDTYDFSESINFTYLNTDSGPQMDRIEFPEWIMEENLLDYVMSIIRAEAAVGRGYPEILQAVDADAVISRSEREKFLRMLQSFSMESDIELRWNNKALSKKRRRR